MNYKIAIFYFVFGITLASACKKNTASISLDSNIWIESKSKKDTITFKDDLLILNRSKEFKNGQLLPQLGAGPYSFKELKDSITLQFALSSAWSPKNYSFRIERNKLYIGDFYQKGNADILVFDKLK